MVGAPGLAYERHERNARTPGHLTGRPSKLSGAPIIMSTGRATAPSGSEHRCGACDKRKSAALVAIRLSPRQLSLVSFHRVFEPLRPLHQRREKAAQPLARLFIH